jgi:uncharacterized protein (TIGR02246 family)
MSTNTLDHVIRAVLDRIYAAWEANDADAFVAPYAANATALLPGSLLPDRAAIHATMKAVFAGPLGGSRAVYEVQSIRPLGAEAAIVISKGASSRPARTGPIPRRARWRPGCCRGRTGPGASRPSTTARKPGTDGDRMMAGRSP